MPCRCGGVAKRIVSRGVVNTENEAPAWLRSVLEVVDKTNPAPHVQAFVRHPTRTNYRRWMQGEGIRPVDHTEHGGPPTYRKPEGKPMREIVATLWRRHRERNRMELYG
jgi:hypothetical protein